MPGYEKIESLKNGGSWGQFCWKTCGFERVKALPHVTISSTMVFNVAKIASARSSSTISLTKSLRVAGPLSLPSLSKLAE